MAVNSVLISGIIRGTPVCSVVGQTGSKLVTMLIETRRSFHQNGVKRVFTDRIPVKCWGKTGEDVMRMGVDGTEVLVTGRVGCRSVPSKDSTHPPTLFVSVDATQVDLAVREEVRHEYPAEAPVAAPAPVVVPASAVVEEAIDEPPF